MNILCPGSAVIIFEGSGAPIYIAGMESTKVWVMLIDNIAADISYECMEFENNGKEETMTEDTRFICKPGIMPVNIPMNMPDMIEIIRESMRAHKSILIIVF